MCKKAFMPAVGEGGGYHRVSGYRMGYAVDGVAPSTGSGAHGGRLPIDVGGKDTGKSKVYAGNDMTALACGSANQGVWFFGSKEPLLLVSGEICYTLLECIHMNLADRLALDLKNGLAIPAGGWMYSEGTAGGASMHLHIDFGRSQDKPVVGRCPWHSIGGGSYAPDDNYPINRALFLPAGMAVHGGVELGNGNVKDNAGYIWHRDTGEQPIGEIRIGDSNYMRRVGPGEDNAIIDWQEWNYNDCKALSGRLYAVYEVRDGWVRITQRGVGSANGQWISAAAGSITYYNDAPAETPTTSKLQTVTIGPVSQGDADAVLAVCKARGLDKLGLYRSAWVNDDETLQTITIGPVSSGDRGTIRSKCQELDLMSLYTEQDGTITVGPLSAGDVATLKELCEQLQLVEMGLYKEG